MFAFLNYFFKKQNNKKLLPLKAPHIKTKFSKCSQTVCYLLLSVLSHLMANILTCYHGDEELPQCGFPVSFLDFQRTVCVSEITNVHSANKSAPRHASHPAKGLLSPLSCLRNVGPAPELVRQREAKWIDIMGQWNHILLKKTSKVCAWKQNVG